ncbi:KxYKxGKxW signal peptide domain-containing protein [Lacticaseibacillus sp. 53-4]|uniref:KxYKxGKxW signal peptide domain-containing protein n=1 Tax=Lacticaseibacillus sp. 53-4 TaxID=2799575 RepID=UPI0019423600|nr:KxYKxGKxW signal peptide domain-containing protein [Lacticaseibacillus sp. 53-4]
MGDKHLMKRLAADTTVEKRHYKLYKRGKLWAVAGISMLFAGSMYFQQPLTAHAATTETPDGAPATESGTAVKPSASAVLQSSVKSAPTDTPATDATKAATKQVTTPAQADQSGQADTQTVAQTPAVSTTQTHQKAKTQSAPVQAQNDSSAQVTSQPVGTATDAGSAATEHSAQKQTVAADVQQAPVQTKTQVDAVAVQADTQEAPTASTASATLDIPSTNVGVGSGVTKDMTALFNMSGHAGDVFTITIPASNNSWGFDGSKAEPIPASVGTTARKQDDQGNWVITNTFTADASVTQKLILYIYGNSKDTDNGPMKDIGTSTSQIKYDVNGKDQKIITMTQTVKPNIAINPIQRQYPAGDDDDSIGSLLPDTEYVYQFTTPEQNGKQDETGSPSSQVNLAVNYGTTITIPVPTGFTLDSDMTAQLNNFKDHTTIAQPGGAGTNIVITVPKGSGNQGWGAPYLLAGRYAVSPNPDPKPLVAPGPATLIQKLGDGDDAPTLTATAKTPWTETMLPSGDGDDSGLTIKGETEVKGNGSPTADKLTLATEDETNQPIYYLNKFSFDYQGAAPQTNATFTIGVPNGFDATGLQVPSEQIDGTAAYLPGTTSYSYQLTLADNSVETGTVAAGGTIKPTAKSAIRKIELTPNLLAPGARSENKDSYGKPVDGMFLLGTLSKTYDNGDPVKVGDVLTTTMSLKVTGNSSITPVSFKQTVVGLQAHVTGYINKTAESKSTFPGQSKSGEVSLQYTGSNGQTTNLIKEPILYAVLPPQLHGFVDEESVKGAKVTTTGLTDGRTLFTFDYSGTGVWVDTSKATNSYAHVFFDNLPDDVAGKYPVQLLIYSPTTPLQSGLQVVKDPILAKVIHANTVTYLSEKWTIDMADARLAASLAQGNQDGSPAAQGNSDIHGDKAQNFYVNMIDATSSAATNSSEVINLPQKDDDQGSTYTFKLTGPVKLPTTFANGDPLSGVVLYSTERATINPNPSSPNGYVPESMVTDWSAIKSIMINVGTIPSRTETGRVEIPGTDDTLCPSLQFKCNTLTTRPKRP